MNATGIAAPGSRIILGDPVPALEGDFLLDYISCPDNGRWYETPLSLEGLARIMRSSIFLQSCLTFKRNLLSETLMPHPWLAMARV